MNATKAEPGYRLAGVASGGSVTGVLYYGDTEIATTDAKSEKDLEKWARSTAAQHKATLTPEESHTFVKTFVL